MFTCPRSLLLPKRLFGLVAFNQQHDKISLFVFGGEGRNSFAGLIDASVQSKCREIEHGKRLIENNSNIYRWSIFDFSV